MIKTAMRDAINAYSIAVAPDSSLKNFRMALIVTGANSRARTCTQEYAAAAKLNRKNHLRAHRKDPDWEAAVPAREFAPVTLDHSSYSWSGLLYPISTSAWGTETSQNYPSTLSD